MPGIYFLLLGMFIGWLIKNILESISIRIEKKQAEKRGKELEKYAKEKKNNVCKDTIVEDDAEE